jgi:hypothetical protein
MGGPIGWYDDKPDTRCFSGAQKRPNVLWIDETVECEHDRAISRQVREIEGGGIWKLAGFEHHPLVMSRYNSVQSCSLHALDGHPAGVRQ